VVDAKGGEVLGTKAMKNISHTKHHQINKFTFVDLPSGLGFSRVFGLK
jgi:hypothetical protein